MREAYRRLLPYLARFKRQALWIVVLGAIASVGSKINILLLHPLVNEILPTGREPAGEGNFLSRLSRDVLEPLFSGLDLFGLGARVSKVLVLVAAMLAAAAVFSLIQFFFVRLARMLGVWMVTALRQDLAEHILRLGMRYHSGRRLGDLLSRLTADVGTSLRLLNLIVEELVQEPFTILSSLVVAFMASPHATLAMILFAPILAWPVAKLGPRVRRRSARSLAKLGDTTQSLAQMFTGIRVVKAFRMERHEAEAFRRANQEFVHQTERMVKAQATGLASTEFLSQAGVAAALGGVAVLSLVGDPVFDKPGDMAVFGVAIIAMITGIKRLTKAMSVIYTSLGATTRVFEVLDLQPEIVETGREQPFRRLKEGIVFDRVSFDYGQGDGPVLREVSFEVRRGERIALVGPSGAGKSTLLDLVARFYDPSAGRILVDGTELSQLRLGDWLDHLALVSQQPFLFQTTLEENIRHGRPGATPAEIEEASRAAYLEDFLASLPAGLRTEVGEAGARLSGGQAQRVTIARAILRDPDVLLLDEATSALDSESERRVQEALENLMQGRTSFVIAHRLSTIQGCDRILVLSEGGIVEVGRHEELLKAGGMYARMWQLQSAPAPG